MLSLKGRTQLPMFNLHKCERIRTECKNGLSALYGL